MKKIEIHVNPQELDCSLEKLNKLKQKSFDRSNMVLEVSKGKAISSQERVFQALEKIDQNLTDLIDETIGFISQSKQGYIMFDEEYAKNFQSKGEE